MTACRNKARGAVVAALAGALTLGAAPVMALADGASLMAQSSQQAFAEGKVTAQDGRGGDVTFPDKGVLTFTEEGQYLLPTSINVAGTDYVLDLKSGTGNAMVEYFDSNKDRVAHVGRGIIDDLAKNHDWAAGTYTAKITYMDEASQYNGCTKVVQFKVVDASLEDATIFNATNKNTDTSVTGFTYNGAAQTVGLAIDGAVVNASEYSLEIYKGNVKIDLTDEDGKPAVKEAGDYTVYVKDSSGKQVKTLSFSVAKLDLTSAKVSLADVEYKASGYMDPATGVVANGHFIGTSDVKIERSFTNDGTSNSKIGAYQATVLPADGNQNVTGKATVTFNVVTHKVDKASFAYGGGTFNQREITINLSNGQSFDESKIKVNDRAVTDPDWVDVTYTDTSGAAVTADDLKTPGTYYVTARVNAELSEYVVGSDDAVMTVVVTAGKVQAKNIVFKYNGEVTSNLKVDYSGANFLESITSEVKVGDKVLEPGTDYELVVLDESDKKVDSIVDAGDYTVEVKSDSYDVPAKGNSLKVKVSPITIKFLYAESDLMRDFGGRVILPYTGEDIDAGFEFAYYTKGGKVVAKGTEGAARNVLPEGAVAVDGIKYLEDYNKKNAQGKFDDFDWDKADVVDALNAEGFYNLYVTVDPEVSVNYKYGTGADGIALTDVVEVSDARVFADVDSNAYYAEAVYQANAEGYVFGMAGTDLFMPDRSISRADMAVVLYRMAGGTNQGESWEASENEMAYLSKYADVDAKAYYAQALAWASQAGIVTGYEDGNFGPNDPVTVEQYVTMLARYAEVKGDYEAVDADEVLAGVADGDQVSEFGQDAVAWAVENGYLAQGGAEIQPQTPVSRGRAVTIAVRYQPEKAGIIGNSGSVW